MAGDAERSYGGGWLRWLMPLVLASAALRVVVALASPVQTTPDSPSYLALATMIRHGTLADDPGERTPFYPLFLAMLGVHRGAARVAQMAIGVAVTAALFWLAGRTTRDIRVATLIGASYGLSLTAAIHEDTILTESLATALLVALACLLVRNGNGLAACRAWLTLSLAIGVLAGLIALTRPVYTFLPVVLALSFFLLRRSGIPRATIAQGICCVLLPAGLLIGGWSARNAVRFGVFSPTILTGYNLSNHAGGFIELAPERDAVLRDIYLRYRAQAIRETGSHANTIWDARPELLARTGLSDSALSRAFGSLSLRLFLHHPGRYAASVAIAWLRFWNSPGMLRWGGARDPVVGRVVGIVWMAERVAFIALNVLFLLLTLGAACARRLRARCWQPSPLLLTLCAIVWTTSIIQALLEYGSNTRFGVPTQPLVAYVVIVSATSLLRATRRSRGVHHAIALGEMTSV